MNLTGNWLKNLESICDQYDERLVTGAEFEGSLSQLVSDPNSPLVAFDYQLVNSAPFETILFGTRGEAEPSGLTTLDQFDSYGSTCRIQVWRKSDAVLSLQESQQINDLLARLIRSYWKPELRDDKSRLISFHNPVTYRLADNSIVRYISELGRLCAFFCDLDQFKKINDTYGMSVGDRVILSLASIVETHALPKGITLHRSGDEFIVLYPGLPVDEALLLGIRMMEAVRSYDFDTTGPKLGLPKLGLSCGIAVLEEQTLSYKELEARAEKATKPGNQIKHRGVVRIYVSNSVELPPMNDVSIQRARCLVKSCVNSDRPFESVWLNMLSKFVSIGLAQTKWQVGELQERIKALLSNVNPDLDQSVVRSALPVTPKTDYSTILSSLDLALAVAHGILRTVLLAPELDFNNKSLVIQDGSDNSCSLLLMPDNLTLASFGDGENNNRRELGGFVIHHVEDFNLIDSRRALLIKIGHFELQIPESIFVDVIVVDDRPTRGGGLPDFWEATVARVISRVNVNPNIAAVYILGKHEHGMQTIVKLQNLDLWLTEAEEMSYKTGMSFQSISVAVERLRDRIALPNTEDELISSLDQILKPQCELKPLTLSTNLGTEYRFMRRILDMDGVALEPADGCRLQTVAQAYPVVLEIARRAGDENLIVDQAGQELRELVDFKVHLSNPMQDLVPVFYEKEASSLDEYFRQQFLSEAGLFGSVFIKSGQLLAVVDHVKNSINQSRPFSSRRAVLVIPHEITGEELAPLGLISVRIVPRISQNRIVLHYSYTWRTVEALVGFPYSLYGSVRFSDYLTGEIKKKLASDQARQIEMGGVSYIAHSLHIFMDEHGQNIARRIVDNASF